MKHKFVASCSDKRLPKASHTHTRSVRTEIQRLATRDAPASCSRGSSASKQGQHRVSEGQTGGFIDDDDPLWHTMTYPGMGRHCVTLSVTCQISTPPLASRAATLSLTEDRRSDNCLICPLAAFTSPPRSSHLPWPRLSSGREFVLSALWCVHTP